MIYLRSLDYEDYEISYKWRNDSSVWQYTGSRPDIEITKEIEKEWLAEVLQRNNERRYAICLCDDNSYIGNVQLTNIDNQSAMFHIFIGEKRRWGKGIGKLATKKILDLGFEELRLDYIQLEVQIANVAACRLYENLGFFESLRFGTTRLMKKCNPNKTPLLSVFVMAYNHENYIAEALDGILMQKTSFRFEIVLGEDCSTDTTRSIVLEYAEKHPHVFKLLLHEDNVGAFNNQNLIFNACEGKYIAMCEGDDYWTDPLKLQKQVDFLEANPDYVACGHRVLVLKDAQLVSDDFLRLTQSEFEQKDLVKGNSLRTLSMVFRIPEEGVPLSPEGILLGDHYLWMSLMRYGRIKVLDDIMGVYRVHAGGVWSGGEAEKKREGLIEHYKALVVEFQDLPISKGLKRWYCYITLMNTFRYVRILSLKKAFKFYKKSCFFGMNLVHFSFFFLKVKQCYSSTQLR